MSWGKRERRRAPTLAPESAHLVGSPVEHDISCGDLHPSSEPRRGADFMLVRGPGGIRIPAEAAPGGGDGDAGMTWTEERVELLKKLWSDGLSASQIAAEIGGVTRNAVIGKVHRLGLSGRAKPDRAGAAAPAQARAPAEPPDGHRPPAMAAPRSPLLRAEPSRGGAARRVRRGRRDPVLGAGHHHGAARLDVPLADGRPDDAGVPLLRRQGDHRPALLHAPSRIAYQPAAERRRERERRVAFR